MATKVRKERQKYETILLEGQRLLLDAIDAGVTIKALYFSKVRSWFSSTLECLQLQCNKGNLMMNIDFRFNR